MTGLERRLHAEWGLLSDLAALNPDRIADLHADDRTFHLTLRETPAQLCSGDLASSHRLRVVYPAFFPSVPLELFAELPFLHPNVHPEAGFVCLWTRHRVDATIEHALHKTVAMMAGELYNREPLHVMQPDALQYLEGVGRASGAHSTSAAARPLPLLGLTHDTFALEPAFADRTQPKRVRLS